jgi:hypothetical protein
MTGRKYQGATGMPGREKTVGAKLLYKSLSAPAANEKCVVFRWPPGLIGSYLMTFRNVNWLFAQAA